nr:uncharacterized protein LOC128674215 isoform X3 [Plodia interpunctella]
MCYVLLYYLVHINSKGEVSELLKTLLLIAIPIQAIHGVMLIYAALERKVWALKLCVYVFLLFATYITIMGWIGLVHYIRTGDVTMHFLLAAIFGCMTLSLITVVCNDVYIIFTYIYMLRSNTINTRTNNNPTNTEPLAVTQEDKNPENATPKVTDIP